MIRSVVAPSTFTRQPNWPLGTRPAAVHRYTRGMTTLPLARAATIPSRYYVDPAILELEKERVFGRTWQLVARADELSRVGDFVPVTVLDEPVVITHGLDGELKAFYNVCRHRAGQVALTPGQPQVAPMPVPRLDLRPGRHAAGLPGDGGDGRIRQGGLRPDPGARGAMGPVRLRQPLADRRAAAARDDGRDPGRGGHGRLRRRPHAAGGAARLRRSSATGRSTSTTTWRATTSRSRTRSCTRSSTTTATGSRSSATTPSSTRRSGS